MQFAEKFFQSRDGLQLYFRDYEGDPAKVPVLCLHGLTRNSRDFAELAERYSPRFRVLALDCRGRGLSDHDPQPMRYNPLTYANDVRQLLDQLGIPQAIFVGTSLGGIVTMLIAASAPERLAGAILNDVGPELSEAGLDRIRGYVGEGVFADWDEAARALAAINRNVPGAFTHGDWVKMARRTCREEGGKVVFDYDPAIAVPFAAVAAAPAVDMWPLFHAVARHHVLVLRGEVSDLLSAEAFERMQEAAPDADFAVVPGVGHAPMLDEREAIVAVDAFLSRFDA